MVTNRLVKLDILKNMYDICGTSGYFLRSDVWECSQLKNHQDYYRPHDLLRYQLMCLKVKGEYHELPTIHIYLIYEKTNVTSKRNLKCVSCISYGSKFSIQGEFDVKLNRYQFGASGKNSLDSVYWEDVIVHEILHNLGHNHEENNYSDRCQINVFEQCFIVNEKYSP